MQFDDLFSEVEKSESLFVIHNEVEEKMMVDEIFDTSKFTDFKAVSYVSSPKFFAETVKGFQSIIFILGIDNVDNLNKFSDGLEVFVDAEDRIKFFNDLPDQTKALICKDKMQIRYGKSGVMIHDKIYLLANEETENYRVIIGSANFSASAFNSENKNFENIRVDDSKKLYDLYLKRFNYLLQQTSDYIPELCRRKYDDRKILLNINPDTEFEVLLEEIQNQKIDLQISGEQLETLYKFQEQTLRETDENERKKIIIENIFVKSATTGKFKIPKVSDFIRKKNIFLDGAKKSKIKVQNDDVRENLLMNCDYKIYKNSADQSGEMEMYSRQIEPEKIKTALEKINRFTQSYFDFALSPNKIIPSKIYEAILYSFTAPFIWKIREKCSMEYDKAAVADIPIFCIIGGSSYSGKSTALEFIAGLLGQHGKKFYDYSRELDKAGIVHDLLQSNNVMPVFADEVSLSFFRRNVSAYKGEEMIKSLSNEVSKDPQSTFIATTNLKDFSSSSQVIRRIYFIGVDNIFDKSREYETKKYLRETYEGLTDDLFKDFTFRFTRAIQNNEEIFEIEDFLSFTRKIFLDYYAECKVQVPEYFPRQIFHDYEDRKITEWRQLFFANRNCFLDKGDTIQVNIDEIFRNSRDAKNKQDKLLNYLDEVCLASDSGIGVNWFFKKKEFYNFINYQPTFFETAKTSLQRIFS